MYCFSQLPGNGKRNYFEKSWLGRTISRTMVGRCEVCHSFHAWAKKYNPKDIVAIGIAYQMHGLVLVDKNKNLLRNSIIWCDSRAVSVGAKAFEIIGKRKCLQQLLNSPENFNASKLAWVQMNEPEVFEKFTHPLP